MRTETLVLGLGNPLLSDEGFGLRAIRRLIQRYRLPADVETVDGGTLGLALLPALESADRIVVFDAVEAGKPPGSLVRIGWDDVPRALRQKISPHQEGLTDALALLEFRRGRPGEFEVIGVQPGSLELWLELTPPVAAALDLAVEEGAALLRAWGHRLIPREPGAEPGAPAAHDLLPGVG